MNDRARSILARNGPDEADPDPRLGGTATILVLLDRVVIAPVIDGAISTPQT
jgi:hypothetical protein